MGEDLRHQHPERAGAEPRSRLMQEACATGELSLLLHQGGAGQES